ncbi:Hypothetical protein Trvi_ORF25 [Trabala vishnou gigantina nucleopolyhedrovirus]|uniref:Hypothetical protein n=1 Tax=Trabala vishnou gigantina nucleopolyhedrovirus TaxID=2863583 RepID=UPI0024819AD2|nr:Hypothetical protein QKU87_gp025 [Trabala vishnou gigantina nucleopolyhedrovirus]QYC92785.1 Hypothetical protein Trvi_ORF25 [Trabala vishnou gigantina nucleopolyhedrovirus]
MMQIDDYYRNRNCGLQINDIVMAEILEWRLYKLHLVIIENWPQYSAILIVYNKKIYFKKQKIRVKVIRIDGLFVDVVPFND